MYDLILQQDTVLDQGLTVLHLLDLNGSTLVVQGKLKYNTLSLNDGNLINLFCEDQLLTVHIELVTMEELLLVSVGYTEAGQLANCELYIFTPENRETQRTIDLSQMGVSGEIKAFVLSRDYMPLAPTYACT